MIGEGYIVKSWKDIPTDGMYLVFNRANTLLAKLIHLGMWLFQILRVKKYPESYPQHSDIVYNGISIGALANGVHPHSLQYRHRKTKDNVVFWVFKPKLSKEERDTIWHFLLDQEGKPYEYDNFLHHVGRIFTGYWKGHTKSFSTKAWYCVELSAAALNSVWKGFVEKPWQVTPFEFFNTVLKSDKFYKK